MALELDNPTISTPPDFRQRFPGIRVEIDWARFVAEDWPIRSHTITDRRALLDLRSFFGIRFGRINPRFLKTVGTRSMRVGEAAGRIESFPEPQRQVILSWADDYRMGRIEPVLTLPTFELPDGTALLLDGNHHATALAIAGVPFEAELVGVSGKGNAGFAGMRFL